MGNCQKVVYDPLNDAIFDDLERPLTHIWTACDVEYLKSSTTQRYTGSYGGICHEIYRVVSSTIISSGPSRSRQSSTSNSSKTVQDRAIQIKWQTSRMPCMVYRMVPISVTLNDLNPQPTFQWHAIIRRW